MPTEPHPLAAPQAARASIRFGGAVVMEADARATPLGMLAVGGLIAAVLLSIPPIIRAAKARKVLLPSPEA
jgi:hypothetical protein